MKRLSSLARTLFRPWMQFWFAPSSPRGLGSARALFYAGLLVLTWSMESAAWARFGELFWFPIPLFRALDMPLLEAPTLDWLEGIWRLTLVTSAVGLFTRPSMALGFVLGFYLLALPHNFGKIHHSNAIVIFMLGVLACSRARDGISVDAWLRRRRGRDACPAASGEYTWPFRMAQMLLSLVFFGAGLAKVRNGGLEWATAEQFRNLLLKHFYTHDPPTTWALVLAEIEPLCHAIALGTIAIELSAPLALAHKWARVVIAPSLFLMQLGIWLLMGVFFSSFFLLYLFWIPWDRIAEGLSNRLQRARSARPAPA